MERKRIVSLLTDIQAGRATKEAIRHAVTSEYDEFIRQNPEAIHAMDLAELLAPEFAVERGDLAAKIREKNQKLYGHDIKMWPDSALDEALLPFKGNPVFDRLHQCYNKAGHLKFIEWAETELKLQSNGKA